MFDQFHSPFSVITNHFITVCHSHHLLAKIRHEFLQHASLFDINLFSSIVHLQQNVRTVLAIASVDAWAGKLTVTPAACSISSAGR